MVLALTEFRAANARSFRMLSADARFSASGVEKVKVLPWDLHCSRRDQGARKPLFAGAEMVVFPILSTTIGGRFLQPEQSRRMYVTIADLRRYGR